ncbi:hypothetical protein TNIN_173171 [Trichonephila inaurata madagascariensis]|uniref:Uncharacterized protein n=1 Tax=Trichonephila inaurata madagascariensis TaxID=2747483 RepID=A0A8X6Y0M2_9ARAC|nr:hypothetical protein TNIN_173171 [Trichonephila inaurata madagascariensis]
MSIFYCCFTTTVTLDFLAREISIDPCDSSLIFSSMVYTKKRSSSLENTGKRRLYSCFWQAKTHPELPSLDEGEEVKIWWPRLLRTSRFAGYVLPK